MTENGTASAQGRAVLFDWNRIRDIFIKPARVCEQINQRPDWAGPLLMVIAVTLLFTHFRAPQLLLEQINLIPGQSAGQNLNQQQVEESQSLVAQYGTLMVYLGTVAQIVAEFFFISLLLFLICRIMVKEKIPFKKFLSLYVYSMLITGAGKLLRIPFILISNNQKFAFSLGNSGLSHESASFLSAEFLKIDIFSIWQFVVLAIGLGILTGIFSYQKSKLAYSLVIFGCVLIFIVFCLLLNFVLRPFLI